MKKKIKDKIKYNNGKKYYTYSYLEKKIEYYKKRITDITLTQKQREYAAKKVNMYTSSIGRIYIINDQLLGNPEAKDRNVIVTSKNKKTNEVLINGIYTSDFRNNRIRIQTDSINVLSYDSYIDRRARYKNDYLNSFIVNSNIEFFKESDLEETTATISPYDIDKINKILYSGKHVISIKNQKIRNILSKRK